MSLKTSFIKISGLIIIFLCTVGATNTVSVKQYSLEAELDYLIGEGVCDSDTQCGSIAYGEKACGGPEGYKIYSLLTSDRAMLLKLSNQYTELSHEKNTNATVNHVLTPPIIIAHEKGFKLFTIGDSSRPASPSLAILAETGSPTALSDVLVGDPMVHSVAIGSFTPPGADNDAYTIIAPKGTRFTVAAMLATTNDAFTAVVGIKEPKTGKTVSAKGDTYDAGEGFVSIHNGIFGKGDLKAADLDWRGATSVITIHNAGKYKN